MDEDLDRYMMRNNYGYHEDPEVDRIVFVLSTCDPDKVVQGIREFLNSSAGCTFQQDISIHSARFGFDTIP